MSCSAITICISSGSAAPSPTRLLHHPYPPTIRPALTAYTPTPTCLPACYIPAYPPTIRPPLTACIHTYPNLSIACQPTRLPLPALYVYPSTRISAYPLLTYNYPHTRLPSVAPTTYHMLKPRFICDGVDVNRHFLEGGAPLVFDLGLVRRLKKMNER